MTTAPMASPTSAAAYGLTDSQRWMLLIIQELTALDGRAPTVQEIARETCVASVGEVHQKLCRLRERGYIDWLPARARSITVLRPIAMPPEPAVALTEAGAAYAVMGSRA